MHRTKVRVVEDALDANNTIARANASDFERSDVTVVKPHERPRRRQDDAARALARRHGRGGLRVGVVNKDYVLQYLDFDVDRLEPNIKQVNHNVTVMRVSAKTGEGVDEFRAWLKALPVRIAAEAHDHDHEHADHHYDHAEQQPVTA